MKQYLEFKNLEELNNYKSKLNNFQEGEIIYLTDEEKFVMYNNNKFNPMPDKVKMEGEGLKMSMYDLNKMVISQLPILKDLTNEINVINEYFKINNGKYFMLLCKEISYYTIFNHSNNYDIETLGQAVTECAQDVGKIISVENTEDGCAIEIWVRTADEENLCMYLFNCEGLIVSFGG